MSWGRVWWRSRVDLVRTWHRIYNHRTYLLIFLLVYWSNLLLSWCVILTGVDRIWIERRSWVINDYWFCLIIVAFIDSYVNCVCLSLFIINFLLFCLSWMERGNLWVPMRKDISNLKENECRRSREMGWLFLRVSRKWTTCRSSFVRTRISKNWRTLFPKTPFLLNYVRKTVILCFNSRKTMRI